MFKTFFNIFRIPELRNKILFTLALLCVYRIGFYVPLPGVDAPMLAKRAQEAAGTALGAISNYLQIFSGGDLGRSTIFGLGIMPYISASIILQLLATVVPALEKLRKEGEPGVRKITEWTRYLTVAVCLVQAFMWMTQLTTSYGGTLLYPVVRHEYLRLFWPMGLIVLTAGSLFLMWLGEQIDQYGIGNGVSLIITAGIISRMPNAIIDLFVGSPFATLYSDAKARGLPQAISHAFQNGEAKYSPLVILFLIAAFVFVVAGSILLTQAQRRIRVQQAKHMRGRKVYGGAQQYLPLRVNHAGVMPIIFASSLMMFPSLASNWLSGLVLHNAGTQPAAWRTILLTVIGSLNPGRYTYELLYVAMVFFFSYFWNTVQFQPKEMANQLRDYGSFIPGLRPGKRTADYLENVMVRITYVGAAFLALIAVVPSIVSSSLKVEWTISQFLGGTGLLIVIQVMLDLINRIEANLVMRNYSGFLETSAAGSRLKDRIRGTRTTPGAPRQPNDSNLRGLPQ